MLECGSNYKGTMNEMCSGCNMKDDEGHRLNYCKKYRGTNFYNSDDKVHFDTVYSNDKNKLKKVIPLLNRVWNIRNANGTMIKQ